MAWQAQQPFNELPLLPPPMELETKSVLKKCIKARAALAELKQASTAIPNPAMLINTLPVLEAQASSEIENIVTTADALFQHQSPDSATDPAAKEALRYRATLLDGFNLLGSRPISTGMAEKLCSQLMGRPMEVRRIPGTALMDAASGEVVYTPPVGEDRLRDLLANWERFLHDAGDIDPLIRVAAAHYQFEAIHPFIDGNGRTGRVINSLALVELGLLSLPILYLSRFIIANKERYYDGLLKVTSERAWEPWLIYVLEGVEETANWTTEKIAAIRQLAEETRGRVQAQLPAIYSHELVDVLFEQPYVRISNVVERGIVGRQAASRYLKALAGMGVLAEMKVGREKLFVNERLLGLLTR